MLKGIDNLNRYRSKYMCDQCGRIISNRNRICIAARQGDGNSYKKLVDLCKECFDGFYNLLQEERKKNIIE